MLVQLVDKQRRGVSVVKTALLGVGIKGRSVCVTIDNWSYNEDRFAVNVAIFVSPPIGENIEPFYETGKTIAEAVKNMINAIKTKKNDAKTEVSEVAPF